jgi:hypothetical protein
VLLALSGPPAAVAVVAAGEKGVEHALPDVAAHAVTAAARAVAGVHAVAVSLLQTQLHSHHCRVMQVSVLGLAVSCLSWRQGI